MGKVLHLYNVFGAATERVWLEVPMRLAQLGWDPIFGAESIALESPPDCSPVILSRRHVAPQQNVEQEMALLSTGPSSQMQTILQAGVSLVHGHTGPRILHAAAAMHLGVPTVISLYGYDASRLLRDGSWGARYRWAAARGAVFVTICQAMQERMIAEGLPTQQVRVIRLGIDPSAWVYRPAPAPERPRFVFTGRLVPKKGVDDLLIAMQRLSVSGATRPHLDIVGKGPLELTLQERAVELGIDELVTFHGAVSRERVAEMLAGATGFVLPSCVAEDGDAEGTPIVLMEAQALGVPCVTTRHSGNPEVLPPEAARLIVPERDPAALAAAMAALSTYGAADRKALQDAGRAWVESHYDLAKTTREVDALYRELTA